MALPLILMNPLVRKIGGGAVAFVALFIVHTMYSGHYVKKGVEKCEAKQLEANEKAAPIANNLDKETDEADDKFKQATDTIRTETNTGITAVHLERSRQDAKTTGKELGRLQAIEEIRSNGGCLTVRYADDSKLLINEQSLQLDVFGTVIKRDETDLAGEVRPSATIDGLPVAEGYYTSRPD